MQGGLINFILVSVLLLNGFPAAIAQTDSTPLVLQLDSSFNDTALVANSGSETILDSLLNDSFINANFRRYASINNHISVGDNYSQREVPSIKEVKYRKERSPKWLFCTLLFILAYIGWVRTFNQKNFKASLNSVFSTKITAKLWEERGVIFNYITMQLFSIFLLISALFVYVVLDAQDRTFLDNSLLMYLAIVGLIFCIYGLKFIAHYFWGWLLQLNKFGISMVSNTITTNNFVALIILPVFVARIYINSPLMEEILTKTIIATFMLSVVYRVARLIILSGTYFRYPLIYIILYLCVFEISPWIIIVTLIFE
jgi:hypothetical protein